MMMMMLMIMSFLAKCPVDKFDNERTDRHVENIMPALSV